MERKIEYHDDDLIELGSVVAETQGAVQGAPDFIGLPQNQSGIADD